MSTCVICGKPLNPIAWVKCYVVEDREAREAHVCFSGEEAKKLDAGEGHVFYAKACFGCASKENVVLRW